MTGNGTKRSQTLIRNEPSANNNRPVRTVLIVIAAITWMTTASSERPDTLIDAAIDAAKTLMTATAGVSGPASMGVRVDVKATINPVAAVPMSKAERPSVNPPAIGP